MMVDYGPQEGSFSEPMTAEDILSIFGGGDDIPWNLCWYNFGLDGTVIYNADGTVYKASIRGVRDTESFTLTLWPGQYPLLSTVYTDAAVQEVDGVEVTSSMTYADTNGDRLYEMTCRATFQVGELGVDFVYTGENGDAATWLPCVLLWNATQADGGFTTEHLVPASIPEEGGQELTQEEAYGADLAIFLPDPDALPLGFRFGGAHRKLDQNWDTLSVLFTPQLWLSLCPGQAFPRRLHPAPARLPAGGGHRLRSGGVGQLWGRRPVGHPPPGCTTPFPFTTPRPTAPPLW